MNESKSCLNIVGLTVDVVIPVYNGEDYILEAIDSVVQQTLPVSKIIIIDDGSTDLTSELVKNYIANKPNLNILYHFKSNGGLSSARNAGIRLSSSNYIAFLDADDIWLPTKLECQVSKLLERSDSNNLGVIYCDFMLIDESGDLIEHSMRPNIIKSVKGSVYQKLLKGNYVSGSGSAVLVRRDCFDKCGFFDELLPSCEDWDMWLRISSKYSFEYVEKKLVKIRRHDNGMQKDNTKMVSGHLLLFNKLFVQGCLPVRNILSLRLKMYDANINCSKFMLDKQTDENFKRLFCSNYILILINLYCFARWVTRHLNDFVIYRIDKVFNFVKRLT